MKEFGIIKPLPLANALGHRPEERTIPIERQKINDNPFLKMFYS